MESEAEGSSDDSLPHARRVLPFLAVGAIGIGALLVGGAIGTAATLGATGQLSSVREIHGLPLQATAPLPELPKSFVSLDAVYNKIRTGKVREYNWEMKWRNCPNNNFNQPCATPQAPGPILHGVRSKVIVINDQTPGPPIIADLGDTIKVTVRNLMNDDISVHWHGITMFATPWMDGTPLVNCNIPPGGTFTYEFIAHPAGTAFYHSHLVTQHESGLSGGIVINDPNDPNSKLIDGSDHLAVFKDWWASPAQTLYYFWQQNSIGGCLTFGNERFVGGFNPAHYWSEPLHRSTFFAVMGDALLFEGLLVNGRGVYNYTATQITVKTNGLTTSQQLCPGQTDPPPKCEWCYEFGSDPKPCSKSAADSLCGAPEIFEVEKGKTSRIRLVADVQLYMLQVCIDRHDITVIAADMLPIQPFRTKCLIMAPGERYDIAVLADQAPGDYMIRFITLEYGAFLESLPFLYNCDGKPRGPCLDERLKGTWGVPAPGLPHQAFAILRYKGAPSGIPAPPDSPNYWLTAVTLGCSSDPTANDPKLCHHVRELRGTNETLSGYFPPSTRTADFVPPAKQKPTVQVSMQVSFLPDEVPRPENKALLSRMQIYKDDRGFPFVWTEYPSGWREDAPIAFTMPEVPTLGLDEHIRNEIYSKRTVWREPNMTNPGELYPNFPVGWSRISSGTNTLSVKYGDVVRIFMNATIPFGAGAAMPHPMHLHGHKMAVLAIGKWDEPYDESKLNTENPIYKDTVPLYSDSWIVVQFIAENPGVWFFHCHVNIHVNSGMGLVIDSGGDQLDFRKTPHSVDMCTRSERRLAV